MASINVIFNWCFSALTMMVFLGCFEADSLSDAVADGNHQVSFVRLYQSINQLNFYSAPYRTWRAAVNNVHISM